MSKQPLSLQDLAVKAVCDAVALQHETDHFQQLIAPGNGFLELRLYGGVSFVSWINLLAALADQQFADVLAHERALRYIAEALQRLFQLVKDDDIHALPESTGELSTERKQCLLDVISRLPESAIDPDMFDLMPAEYMDCLIRNRTNELLYHLQLANQDQLSNFVTALRRMPRANAAVPASSAYGQVCLTVFAFDSSYDRFQTLWHSIPFLRCHPYANHLFAAEDFQAFDYQALCHVTQLMMMYKQQLADGQEQIPQPVITLLHDFANLINLHFSGLAEPGAINPFQGGVESGWFFNVGALPFSYLHILFYQSSFGQPENAPSVGKVLSMMWYNHTVAADIEFDAARRFMLSLEPNGDGVYASFFADVLAQHPNAPWQFTVAEAEQLAAVAGSNKGLWMAIKHLQDIFAPAAVQAYIQFIRKHTRSQNIFAIAEADTDIPILERCYYLFAPVAHNAHYFYDIILAISDNLMDLFDSSHVNSLFLDDEGRLIEDGLWFELVYQLLKSQYNFRQNTQERYSQFLQWLHVHSFQASVIRLLKTGCAGVNLLSLKDLTGLYVTAGNCASDIGQESLTDIIFQVSLSYRWPDRHGLRDEYIGNQDNALSGYLSVLLPEHQHRFYQQHALPLFGYHRSKLNYFNYRIFPSQVMVSVKALSSSQRSNELALYYVLSTNIMMWEGVNDQNEVDTFYSLLEMAVQLLDNPQLVLSGINRIDAYILLFEKAIYLYREYPQVFSAIGDVVGCIMNMPLFASLDFGILSDINQQTALYLLHNAAIARGVSQQEVKAVSAFNLHGRDEKAMIVFVCSLLSYVQTASAESDEATNRFYQFVASSLRVTKTVSRYADKNDVRQRIAIPLSAFRAVVLLEENVKDKRRSLIDSLHLLSPLQSEVIPTLLAYLSLVVDDVPVDGPMIFRLMTMLQAMLNSKVFDFPGGYLHEEDGAYIDCFRLLFNSVDREEQETIINDLFLADKNNYVIIAMAVLFERISLDEVSADVVSKFREVLAVADYQVLIYLITNHACISYQSLLAFAHELIVVDYHKYDTIVDRIFEEVFIYDFHAFLKWHARYQHGFPESVTMAKELVQNCEDFHCYVLWFQQVVVKQERCCYQLHWLPREEVGNFCYADLALLLRLLKSDLQSPDKRGDYQFERIRKIMALLNQFVDFKTHQIVSQPLDEQLLDYFQGIVVIAEVSPLSTKLLNMLVRWVHQFSDVFCENESIDNMLSFVYQLLDSPFFVSSSINDEAKQHLLIHVLLNNFVLEKIFDLSSVLQESLLEILLDPALHYRQRVAILSATVSLKINTGEHAQTSDVDQQLAQAIQDKNSDLSQALCQPQVFTGTFFDRWAVNHLPAVRKLQRLAKKMFVGGKNINRLSLDR